jgi:hypothetical protein
MLSFKEQLTSSIIMGERTTIIPLIHRLDAILSSHIIAMCGLQAGEIGLLPEQYTL